MSEFKTARFMFAAFFSVTTTIGFFTDRMSDGNYNAAVFGILGIFGTIAAVRGYNNRDQ